MLNAQRNCTHVNQGPGGPIALRACPIPPELTQVYCCILASVLYVLTPTTCYTVNNALCVWGLWGSSISRQVHCILFFIGFNIIITSRPLSPSGLFPTGIVTTICYIFPLTICMFRAWTHPSTWYSRNTWRRNINYKVPYYLILWFFLLLVLLIPQHSTQYFALI